MIFGGLWAGMCVGQWEGTLGSVQARGQAKFNYPDVTYKPGITVQTSVTPLLFI